METNEAAAALAHAKRGAMQAAAGCGKTMVISVAVARHGGGRELVLTHTHAGVDALRRRLVELGAPIRSYKLDTIAGWALRLAASFPCAASLSNCKPRTDDDYSTVYRGAEILVRLKPIQEILQASYSGVYVDEYQDCSIEQHALVVALSMVLPCRIVGDPLQGIFDFRGIPVVDWFRHVASQFKEVPGPTVAWRWQNSNPDLGTWLQAVRCKLLAGAGVNLRDAPIRWLSSNTEIARLNNQRQACFDSIGINGDSVVAIHQWPGQCHDISRRLNGSFSCVEPIDVDDLFKFARLIDSTSGLDRAIAVLDFASKCMTGIRTQLSTIRKAFEKNRVPAIRKYKMQLDVLLAVANSGDPRVINTALDALNRIPSVVIFRRELLNEMFRTVRAYADGEASSMSEAAWVVRSRTRQIGRRLPRCVIGTTLLVKGLEFDHAVILDADAHDAKNLYVALTRGSKTLTIVSKSSFLQPRK